MHTLIRLCFCNWTGGGVWSWCLGQSGVSQSRIFDSGEARRVVTGSAQNLWSVGRGFESRCRRTMSGCQCCSCYIHVVRMLRDVEAVFGRPSPCRGRLCKLKNASCPWRGVAHAPMAWVPDSRSKFWVWTTIFCHYILVAEIVLSGTLKQLQTKTLTRGK